MKTWFNPAHEIERLLLEAADQCPLFDKSFLPDVRPADPRFGDFQANGILPFAREKRMNPRDAASALVEILKKSEEVSEPIVSITIAGPGFINFKLSHSFLINWLKTYREESDLNAAAGEIYRDRRIVIDFSSPNNAKQMHVGHLRSTVIGESLARLLEFCGAKVIRDNHIGDWGTPFGMIIMAMKREGYALTDSSGDPLEDIENLYRLGYSLTEKNPKDLKTAQDELVKLQQGERENTDLWKTVIDLSYRSFEDIYRQLGVHFDYVLGESFYRDKVDAVYEELSRAGIAEESEGALVVFHPEHPRFCEQPFIVRKRDGASNYATTDLATIRYRKDEFNADKIIYVVGSPQSDHFEQLFLTAQKWFENKGIPVPEFEHVKFGTILGEDGKAIKTRSGEPIRLKKLLAEAVERALEIVVEKNPDLSFEEQNKVAEIVGIGAVTYADLMQNRTSDYIFSWPKLLSFEGNTAPYLLYAVARIHSIFRRVGIQPGEVEEQAEALETEQEIALARKLVGFVNALNQVVSDLRPHTLCTYLYELAGTFSSFYSANRVIVDDPQVKARRLMLCARTLRILETGLHILGLRTLERM